MLDDDVTFRAPGGICGKGKAACVAFFGGWFSAFPDAHVEVRALHLINDAAVEEGTFIGTHNGILHTSTGDVPPTGSFVEVDYLQVLHFRDGKHVLFDLMFDRLLMIEQLGLVPTPASAE